MTQEKTYPFSKAAQVANFIYSRLSFHCQRIDIAGSIRRLRPDVKDIEIVCIPNKEEKQSDLFGNKEMITDRAFVEALAEITDIVILGNVEGRYMKIRTSSKVCPGIHLDLFMPDPVDYYRQLAIRTGSADYAHQVLANAWRRKGWVGVQHLGLRREEECFNTGKDKNIWKLYHSIEKPTLPPVWASEQEFFKWIGVELVDPQLREVHNSINISQ
ncbi:MAG: hypothetical protein IAE96_04995 [Chitinophagaceae bacterium]|nr:hypothetical protein [Chitinophagaceae bacterium]